VGAWACVAVVTTGSPHLMYAYIVLSLLVGVRTVEARAPRDHVDLHADAPVPSHVAVWRSVRVHGETKTERSRRTLGLPQMAVEALRALLESQAHERLLAGERWQDCGLVFTTHTIAVGPELRSSWSVRGGAKTTWTAARMSATRWTCHARAVCQQPGPVLVGAA
jgi:hypothetical protein